MPKEPHKVGLVCARGLGDALLFMILAHNLTLSGKKVTLFSSILCELKEWFPSVTILPHPQSDSFSLSFSPFDTLIAADHSIIKDHHSFGNQLVILKESHFDRRQTMVENLKNVCVERLHLPFAYTSNGIKPPDSLTSKKYKRRVILHPMSSNKKKNWPAAKFIRLATLLEKEGYDPFFCMSPSEAKQWQAWIHKERLPTFLSVRALAEFVYESGYFIGNDSGVGHLASALQIPTLSLFARKSYSTLWRPGWGQGVVITPPEILPGSRLKQKYWQALLSVPRVLKAFLKLSRL
jgi:ADP-heptose:LPS heptosyltransferase